MKILFYSLIFLTLFAPICRAAEAEILVIFSSDINPYRQSLDGFNTALRERNVFYRTTEHNLAREEADAIMLQISGKKPALSEVFGR